MMAGLARLIDWIAIQGATVRMPEADGRDPHLDQAQRLIASPEFIPAKVEAAKVQFGSENRLRFATPCPGPFAENNVVHGRFYRCAERWQEHPTVFLLHGWNDVIDHYYSFPRAAGKFNRSGINVVALEAPFHFQRRPRHLGAWSNFLSPDILRTVEATRQAIAETRAFAEWLRQQGCPALGILGVSLGGWLTGLNISRDASFSCAVLLVPAARMDRLLQEADFCKTIRTALKGQPIHASGLILTQIRPAMAREKILLIEALHDLFVPPDTMEELWRAWDQPEIWRLRYGHISILAAPGLYPRIIQWMTPHLRAPVSK
jgi:dienelactone hydrolase